MWACPVQGQLRGGREEGGGGRDDNGWEGRGEERREETDNEENTRLTVTVERGGTGQTDRTRQKKRL